MTERILLRDPAEEIDRAFSLFDENKTGKISFSSVKRVIKELDEPVTDEEMSVPFSLSLTQPLTQRH